MKKSLLLAFVLCLCTQVWAASITSEQARQKALQFMNTKGMVGTLQQTLSPSARKRSFRLGTTDYYYVFNVGQDQGYVIVSGDDSTPAVLGYSTHGTFDVDKIPSNMAAWLQGYADQIRYIQERSVIASTHSPKFRVRRAARAAIPGLIKTKWDQTSPYNDECPEYKGSKCVTGCVNTALAQVMYYYQAPSGVSKEIPGYTTGTLGIACESLPATTFDWGSMTTTYDNTSSEAAKTAVAKLMKYCGYASQADFTLDNTSTYNDRPAYVLKEYFGYGSGVQYVMRNAYSDADWDELIYRELEAGRPVIYGGQASDGGHTFVVHGYTNDGYYIVNWGWGGFQDGNYLLDALTPTSSGVGGNDSSGAGYNFDQDATVGISTEDVTPYQVVDEVIALATDYMEVDEGTEYTRDANGQYYVNTYACFFNKLSNAYDFDYDFKVTKDGELKGYLYNGQNWVKGMGPGYYFPYTPDVEREDIFSLYLPDGNNMNLLKETGTWKLIPVSRKHGDTEWYENFGSDKWYLTAVIDANDKLTLYVGDPAIEPEEPEPTPTPEVFDADRETLAARYDALKKSVSDKITAVSAINSRLSSIESSLEKLDAEVKSLTDVITAVEAKLANEYLTDTQKENYQSQLSTLRTQLAALSDQLSELAKEKDSLEKNNNTRSSKLDKLSEDIVSAATAVATITTKEALETSTAKADELDKEQADISVTSDDQSLSALESALGDFSLTTLYSDVEALSSAIDAAIDEAKAAAEAADAALKLANAKESFKQAADTFDGTLSTIAGYYAEYAAALTNYNEMLADLNETIVKLQGQIAEISQKIEELSAQLSAQATRTRTVTTEDLTNHQETLKQLNDNIATLEEQCDKLLSQIETVNSQNSQLEDIVSQAETEATRLGNEAEAATTADAVDQLTIQLEDVRQQLSSNGTNVANTIGSNLNVIVYNLNILTDNVSIVARSASQLQTSVEADITAIDSIATDGDDTVKRYDLQGRRVDATHRGVQILKRNNGKTQVIFNR